MDKSTAILLPILILYGNPMTGMNALKSKQEAIAKAQRAMPPKEAADSEVAANFAKWESEAKNKCKTEEKWRYIAGFEGNAIAQWKYIFEQSKTVIEKLGKDIYDQMFAEKDANGGKWPTKYSDIVTNLQKKHSHYMDQLVNPIPTDLDLSDLNGYESAIMADLKKLIFSSGDRDAANKYLTVVQERTKWTQESIEQKVAAEFDAWAKAKTFRTDEEKRNFIIDNAAQAITAIQGPNMFTGFSDKNKALIRQYATRALMLINQNKDKTQKPFFEMWLNTFSPSK